MDRNVFNPDCPGHLVAIDLHKRVRHEDGTTHFETVPSWAYSPNALPPSLDWRGMRADLFDQLADAREAIGRVNGLTTLVTNADALLASLWLREAKFSSAIENVHTTALDMALAATAEYKLESSPALEAWNAVRAIEHGLKSDLPYSVRLICEMHIQLLHGVRGEDKSPGKFRTIPAYIGEKDRPEHARFVPPPPGNHPGCVVPLMADLERFVNADRGEIPSLLAVAMAHYQFETIHPFRDGNGRIGRALIVHDLCKRGLLDHQVIFLSGYINKHKHRYYETLLGVSTGSAWERWFAFFLDAVIDQARETAVLAKRLFRLRETYIDAVKTNGLPARLLTLIDALFERPIVNARVVAQRLGVTDPTARKDIGLLVEHNVLALTADVAWGQTWYAKGILDIVETTDDADEP